MTRGVAIRVLLIVLGVLAVSARAHMFFPGVDYLSPSADCRVKLQPEDILLVHTETSQELACIRT